MAQSIASVFEERAENLTRAELESWTLLTPREKRIIQKLTGPGAKLLTGPRGSGKSTLLKTAYFELGSSREALAVYVNYSKSLALEPLFHQRADALQIFRQWLLCKIIIGTFESYRDLGESWPDDLKEFVESSVAMISACEAGEISASQVTAFGPTFLMEFLERASSFLGCDRVVVLMDDAAHAFSAEQQREFFEVFRELRTRKVSCKAAVYPGVTSYSPNFNVGHEAELIEAWSEPHEASYLKAMRSLVDRRLPDAYRQNLSDRTEIIDYLALAAFGVPRSFINMLADVLDIDSETAAKPTKLRATQAVANQAAETRGVFLSLGSKLPRFSNFIRLGADLERELIRTLSEYNSIQSSLSKKANVVAIEHPISTSLQKILNLLEYAGMVRPVGEVSRGVKGRFSRLMVHHSLIISGNGLKLGKSPSMSDVVVALSTSNPHAFARTKPQKLLPTDFDEKCTLDLPACICGAARVAEDQRFCMKCGAELSNASIYNELLNAPINCLALPPKKVSGILQSTKIKTVQDILLDDELQQLRKVPRVGPIWARKIRTAAMEFVSV